MEGESLLHNLKEDPISRDVPDDRDFFFRNRQVRLLTDDAPASVVRCDQNNLTIVLDDGPEDGRGTRVCKACVRRGGKKKKRVPYCIQCVRQASFCYMWRRRLAKREQGDRQGGG